MSQENVEVAVKQFEGTNARDFAGVMDTWAQDVTLIVHAEVALGGTTATGKAAVGEWFGDWFRQFGRDYRFDIEETHDAGDRVLVLVTHHGRGRHSGVTVEQGAAHVYTLREGKVSRIEVWVAWRHGGQQGASGTATGGHGRRRRTLSHCPERRS